MTLVGAVDLVGWMTVAPRVGVVATAQETDAVGPLGAVSVTSRSPGVKMIVPLPPAVHEPTVTGELGNWKIAGCPSVSLAVKGIGVGIVFTVPWVVFVPLISLVVIWPVRDVSPSNSIA